MKTLKERTIDLNQILQDQKEDFQVQYEKILKNNNQYKEGYSLIKPGSAIMPICYLDPEEWNKIDDKALVDYLVNVNKSYVKNSIFDENVYITREFILNNTQFILLNQCNKEWIEENDIFYKQYLDFVIVFQVVLSNASESTMTMRLKKSLMEQLLIDTDTLLLHTMAYMNKEMSVFSIMDYLSHMDVKDISEGMDSKCQMMIITNKKNMNGAGYMLCDTVIEKLKQIFNDQFIILPSSIHEIIAISYDEKSRDFLKKAVVDINRTMVSNEEWLSDNIYLWNKDHYEII